ncbi:ABC transporter permease subunit [Syntrophomonas palmitatica]|uniref:ABC transporter permease subunit n=1 Tax=Syntrophomonas palmitatica TaxID=402877 RepID=UPI0006D1451D|nr:ABC transporter permease subunit [Syntrophomonas palmitatica]
MNIVLRELRSNLTSLVIWCLAMIILIAIGMVKFAGLEAAGQSAHEFLNQLPPVIKGILGINYLDLTSISGFYGIFFLYFSLLGGTHAVMLGADIISKEERDKSADFLFVKPVTRSKIITAKLAAVIINLAVFNLVTYLASLFFAAKYNRGEPINNQIGYLMISLFMQQFIYASIGLTISGLANNAKRAASLSTALFLTTFFLSAAIDLYNKIDFLKYLTPFKYFPVIEVMKGSFSFIFIFLTAAIITACTVLTYITYQKRDIYI